MVIKKLYSALYCFNCDVPAITALVERRELEIKEREDAFSLFINELSERSESDFMGE